MLGHAFRAELYKALRSRQLMFWGFLAVPLFMLIFGVLIELLMPANTGKAGFPLPTSPFFKAARAAGIGGNSFIQLFYCIAAASLFAMEYRWETWRIVAMRNSRADVLLAKFGVFLAGAVCSLVLVALAAFFSAFLGSFMHGAPVASPQPGVLTQLVLRAGVSLLELAAVGALAGLLAVCTRSVLGGLLSAFLLAVVQSFLVAYFAPPPALDGRLAVPAVAGEMLHSWAMPSGGAVVTDAIAAFSAVSLAGWTVAALAAAIAVVRRQDLSRE